MNSKLIVGKLYRRNDVPHNSHSIIHAHGGGLPETWTWNVRAVSRNAEGSLNVSAPIRIDIKSAIMYLGKEIGDDIFLYEDKRLIVMYPEEVLELIEGEE